MEEENENKNVSVRKYLRPNTRYKYIEILDESVESFNKHAKRW